MTLLLRKPLPLATPMNQDRQYVHQRDWREPESINASGPSDHSVSEEGDEIDHEYGLDAPAPCLRPAPPILLERHAEPETE
jgi:hypothetical protein